MLLAPLLLVVALLGCRHGNAAEGFALLHDAPSNPLESTTQLATLMTSRYPVSTTTVSTSARLAGAHTRGSTDGSAPTRGSTGGRGVRPQVTTPEFTRVPVKHVSHTVAGEPTPSTDILNVSTGEQFSPAGESPSASVLAIAISICVLVLMFGGIMIALCLKFRSRRHNSDRNAKVEDGVDQDCGGWRERLASHIQSKRKDARNNADDNHPCVVYNVKEGHAESFIRSRSFADMPPLSATAEIEDEVVDAKDVDPILAESESNMRLAGSDVVSTVRGIENIGYLPDSPQINPRKHNLTSIPREGAMSADNQASGDTFETNGKMSESVPVLINKHDKLASTLPDFAPDSKQTGRFQSEPLTSWQIVGENGSWLDDTAHQVDNTSARSSISDGSSVYGFWAPNEEAIDRGEDDQLKAIQSESSSGEDDSVDEVEGEPPYSTWQVRKTSGQFSESGSDVSAIEPIASEEEEDPYDTIIPGSRSDPGEKTVKPRVECISELQGEFSDSDEESPYDTLPGQAGLEEDKGQCEDADCKGCRLSTDETIMEERLSPYETADQCDWPNLDLTQCKEHSDLDTCNCDASEEESPYDTVPPGRPMSVKSVKDPENPVGDLETDVRTRHPTYTTVPDDVLGPYFKERVETFFVDDVSSSSEESLADEVEVGIDTKRMSLEIEGFEIEDEGRPGDQCQGDENEDSFVMVDGEKYSESLNTVDSENIEKRQSMA